MSTSVTFCDQPAITGVPQAEYEALVTFYTSTNGPGWTNKTNWNTATAVGTWYGVTVSGGHVMQLVLDANQLSGTIPDLSALTQLGHLYLNDNQLSGSIPDLSAFTQLQTLNLQNNQLSGSIPDLPALTQLQYLYPSNNQLVSLIPPSITGTAIGTPYRLNLCGKNNIIASNDPAVTAWVQEHDWEWGRGCGHCRKSS